MNKITLAAAFAAAITLLTPHLNAQDASPTPAATPSTTGSSVAAASPDRASRMAEFRQRMDDRLKTALKATDDEWTVIQPLLDKVNEAQMATMAGRFGGMRRMFGGGRGGRNGGNGGTAPGGSPAASPAADNGGNRGFRGGQSSPEAEALQTALDSDGTSTDDIKAKLQALRDTRKKAEANLEEARENLKKVLTLRQEATLVEMGLLD